MQRFVANYMRRIDANTDDSSEAALELGLLLELYFLPHPNRARTTSAIIGKRLVSRGLSPVEVEDILKTCVDRLKDIPRLSPHIVNLLANSYDERVIPALLEAIPSTIGNKRLETASANAVQAMCNFVLSKNGTHYRRDVLNLLVLLEHRLPSGEFRDRVAYLRSIVGDRTAN